MKEKFQKIFGTQGTDGAQTVTAFGDDVNDAAQQRRVARITQRRRLLGFAAIALLVLILAPAFFEPDMATADRTALTVIPPLATAQEATRVEVKTLPKVQVETAAPTPDEKSVRSTAKALTAANPVSNNTKRAPGVADGDVGGADPIGAILGQTNVSQNSGKAPEVRDEAKAGTKTVSSLVKAAPVSATNSRIIADPEGRWYIQIFATANKQAAQNKVQSLIRMGLPSYIEPVKRRGTDLWRVRVGRFGTMENAKAARDLLALHNESNGGISQLPQEKK